ncbi:uncharacterized protein LOC109537018 isoform X5 [Dendroctonus ponderosae]|uniref:uncharacterized protein LOC109537018 isoform X5 n=1 Tax=Dendroctonus ponderosae TaxID=77166 RepID=UPI002034EC6A|nr:uncharacterized protein LOC109537018 isoform X5 [Dendroctonus ponderosae]
MPQCAVVGCNNTHRRTKGGSVKYHRFPGDSVIRHQWLKACGKSVNNCATARICSRHFSEASYERDVQHEILGLPTRSRLKRGALPDQNLPNDFLNEEAQPESAIDILLAVGLVPANKSNSNNGGLPEDLNKMQIMEDVREGCDTNPPSSPGHAEQGEDSSPLQEIKKDATLSNGLVKADIKSEIELSEVIKQEQFEKRSNDEMNDKEEENSSSHSINSENNEKRKLDQEHTSIKRLKTEPEDSFIARDKIIVEFMELAECNNLDQIQNLSDQIFSEIKALNDLARDKEREWNQLLHMKKLKEELLIRLQRKRQVLIINDSDLNDFQPENNGQQSLLKCNQKVNMLRELRAANIEKLKQRNMLQSTYKQKPMLDVQSIIADYRQRHPETVPRRGRRIRNSQSHGKTSILGFSGGSLTIGQSSGMDNHESGLSGSLNGSQEDSRSSLLNSCYRQCDEIKSYKDVLLQFAKLSQSEKSELQNQMHNIKPPPPYPEVTVHPVTSTSSVTPSNSLLHGILTKAPVKQNHSNGNSNTPVNGKSSFSPTLARLLTAPEKAAIQSSTSNMLGGSLLNASNMSISDIFSGSKIDEDEQTDRLVIDEALDNSSTRIKEDNRSEDGEEVPQCQGCNQQPAQFVCAGCGNQWYCSRDCQAGRIGVFGGSIEFTGAPYFSSIAALKVGADLSYVFTIKDAAFVIKSYSPELMVLPFLDDPDAIKKINPWIDRLHVALLGPGLGRLEATQKVFEEIIDLCRIKNIPLLIDADGLFFIAQNPDIIKDYPRPVILTPNKMEFRRIVGESVNGLLPKVDQAKQFLERVGPNVTIFCKDAVDEIVTLGKSIQISGGGSGRRCGGQGDMLGGTMSTFLVWALEKNWQPAVACYAASKLTRDCNSKGFAKYGRSMVVTDMIHELPGVFRENFELKE